MAANENNYLEKISEESWIDISRTLIKKLNRERELKILYKRITLVLAAIMLSILTTVSGLALTRTVKAYNEAISLEERSYHPYIVRDGDTLQGIAKRYCGSMNWRKYLNEIIRLNRLTDDHIEIGETIIIGYNPDEFVFIN